MEEDATEHTLVERWADLGRRLKNELLGPSNMTFREIVHDFLQERSSVRLREGSRTGPEITYKA